MTKETEQLKKEPYYSKIAEILISQSTLLREVSDGFSALIEMSKESEEYKKNLIFGDELLKLKLKFAFELGWMAALNYMQRKNSKEK